MLKDYWDESALLALRESGVVTASILLGLAEPRFTGTCFEISSFLVRDSRGNLVGVTERPKFYDVRDSIVNAAALMATEIAVFEAPTQDDVLIAIEDALERGEIDGADADRHREAGFHLLRHIPLLDRLARKLFLSKQLYPDDVRRIYFQRPRKYSRSSLPWVIEDAIAQTLKIPNTIDVRAIRAATRLLRHSDGLTDTEREELVNFLVNCCKMECVNPRYIFGAIRAILRDFRIYEDSARWLPPRELVEQIASHQQWPDEVDVTRSAVRQAIQLLWEQSRESASKLKKVKQRIRAVESSNKK